MKRAGLVALWVAASFATALVAWSAVRVAGDQVADRPVRPLSADEVAALAPATVPPPAPTVPTSPTGDEAPPPPATTITAPARTTAPTRPPTPTTTTRPRATSTTAARAVPPPPATTTTSPPPAPSTTSPTTTTAETTTTVASTTTTTVASTTTTTVASRVEAYQLTGGSVVISVSPGSVSLVSATPRAGYAMQIEDAGPREVRVEFEGEEDSKFRARWSDGALDVDIDE